MSSHTNREELADSVILVVKAAMAPLLERVAAAEARMERASSTERTISELRERLVTLETKAAANVLSSQQLEPVAADLAPLLERIAAAEARIAMLPTVEKSLGDVRDRVVVVETKSAAAPVVQSVGPTAAEVELLIRDQVQPLTKELDALGLRVTAVETKPEPTPAPVAAGPTAAETELALRDRVEPLTKQLAAMSERVAVLEVKAPIPGPAGQNGKDGRDGKDGADGMGWDDLGLTHDGERTFTLKFMRGERVKEAGSFTVPVDIYRGVYVEGKTYERGDGVTWGGSEWHCNETTTTKPGEGSKAWTLKVKRGRDGKDGKDGGGDGSPPIVLVGGGRKP